VNVKVLDDACEGIANILRMSDNIKKEKFISERLRNWVGAYNSP